MAGKKRKKIREKPLSKAKLGQTFKQARGTVALNKGSIVGLDDDRDVRIRLVSWDAIPDCYRFNGEDPCPVWDMCDYDPHNTAQRGRHAGIGTRCVIQYDYIKEFEIALLNILPADTDQMTMYRIGMHLVPLYKQLCKLNMEEVHCRTMVKKKGGGSELNPILVEIRKVIKDIEAVWKSIDFMSQRKRRNLLNEPSVAGSKYIDKSYYDMMEDGQVDGLLSRPDQISQRGFKLRRLKRGESDEETEVVGQDTAGSESGAEEEST